MHRLKKSISRATVSRKTIESHAGAEYASEKASLLRTRNTLKEVIKSLEAEKAAWHTTLQAQKAFSEAVLAEVESESELGNAVTSGVDELRELQSDLVQYQDDTLASSMDSIKQYSFEVAEVMKEFKLVEENYSEVARYEKKVGKLSKRKKEEKTNRNLLKLKTVRDEYEGVLKRVVQKVRKVNEGFEDVLALAFYAFWKQEDVYLSHFQNRTLGMREWAQNSGANNLSTGTPVEQDK